MFKKWLASGHQGISQVSPGGQPGVIGIFSYDPKNYSIFGALRVLVMQWKLEVIIPTVYSINNALTVFGIAINRKLVPSNL